MSLLRQTKHERLLFMVRMFQKTLDFVWAKVSDNIDSDTNGGQVNKIAIH